MHDQKKEASVADLRKTWRGLHVKGVVCGGWIEDQDGKWESKQC
jgi:hypothetical protein